MILFGSYTKQFTPYTGSPINEGNSTKTLLQMVLFGSCTKQLPSIRVYSMDEGDFAKTFP